MLAPAPSAVIPVASDLLDETGRYRLAIADQLAYVARLPDDGRRRCLERFAAYLQTPAGQYRPLPVARRFHRSDARFRWCLGGNRSSKSRSVAQEVYWFATGTHPYRRVNVPNVGWYCTLTWELVGSILWPVLKELLSPWPIEVAWHNRADGVPKAVKGKIPSAASGDGFANPAGYSQIIFKAYEQGADVFQGAARRWIANDEQFPQDVFVEQVSRIGADDDLDFFAAMTPIKSQPWLEERLAGAGDENSRSGNWAVFNYPLDDNRTSRGGFIPDERIDAMIAEWPAEVVATRRNGTWGSYVGAIFQSFNRSTHVVDEAKERELLRGTTIPVNLPSYGGIDWGGANAFVFLWATKLTHLDDTWYIYDEYFWDHRAKGIRRLADHAAEIKARTAQWRATLRRTWADHDPTDANELLGMGVPSQPATKDVRPGIETMQTLLKVRPETNRPRLMIARRCVNLIREMSTYRWTEGTERRDARDEPVKKDDHAVDAARYVLHSERHIGNVPMMLDLGAENARAW
jgi:phage terminase large subunit-like protein